MAYIHVLRDVLEGAKAYVIRGRDEDDWDDDDGEADDEGFEWNGLRQWEDMDGDGGVEVWGFVDFVEEGW